MASKLSPYDFSTLYTTLSHHLIKDKLIALIELMLTREKTLYLAYNEEHAFFTSDVYKHYKLWSCQNVCEALVYLLGNIFIRFESKCYRKTVGILVVDLFIFCLWLWHTLYLSINCLSFKYFSSDISYQAYFSYVSGEESFR